MFTFCSAGQFMPASQADLRGGAAQSPAERLRRIADRPISPSCHRHVSCVPLQRWTPGRWRPISTEPRCALDRLHNVPLTFRCGCESQPTGATNEDRLRHGARQNPRAGRTRAQSQECRRRAAARQADRDHRPVRLGQVLACLRHHLCRGPAPLCREPVGLCPPVPGDDAEAGRGSISRACRRRSPSSRRPRRRTRAPPSAR